MPAIINDTNQSFQRYFFVVLENGGETMLSYIWKAHITGHSITYYTKSLAIYYHSFR